MKKNFISMILLGVLSMNLLAGCGTNQTTNNNSKFQRLETDMKVGMVTDSGTIDDRAFNQGAWEGIQGAVKNAKYLKPSGVTDADYEAGISNLYDGDYKFIVAPGYKFERAVYTSQSKYPDAKFVILDGAPTDANGKVDIGQNSVAIYFAEQEAGFLAGIAAAVQMQNSEFGFIGGMPIPSVQKFNWGFQQGITYANQNLGTTISLKPENIVYQGSFNDKAGGQQIAGQMYNRGVKVIFAAAGGTGIGAITEAKSRASQGDTSFYVIGVDVDQYGDGIYNTDTNASVILTSAMKYIDQATYNIIEAEVNGNFTGGQALTFSIANDGVGIPSENPNLGEAALNAYNEVYAKIKAGEITVMNQNDGTLIK